jgi:hypothetical protein
MLAIMPMAVKTSRLPMELYSNSLASGELLTSLTYEAHRPMTAMTKSRKMPSIYDDMAFQTISGVNLELLLFDAKMSVVLAGTSPASSA